MMATACRVAWRELEISAWMSSRILRGCLHFIERDAARLCPVWICAELIDLFHNQDQPGGRQHSKVFLHLKFAQSADGPTCLRLAHDISFLFGETMKQLVWRGAAQDTLSDKPEKNEKKLEKSVDKMLEHFPHRPGLGLPPNAG